MVGRLADPPDPREGSPGVESRQNGLLTALYLLSHGSNTIVVQRLLPLPRQAAGPGSRAFHLNKPEAPTQTAAPGTPIPIPTGVVSPW